jgi:hypothetical protein
VEAAGTRERRTIDEKRLEREQLLRCNEELVFAAREFGDLINEQPEDLSELEDAAQKLDEAALAYGRAICAYGPCEWVLGEVMMIEGADVGAEELAERSAALYSAAEAVADLSDGGQAAAVEAARTILGRVAIDFYRCSRNVVAYTVTLVGQH